jgi:hypothetical protein
MLENFGYKISRQIIARFFFNPKSLPKFFTQNFLDNLLEILGNLSPPIYLKNVDLWA